MKLQDPYKNYPRGYREFDQLVKSGHKTTQIGFQTDANTVYRFTNRFRLAKEFNEIKFDTYKGDTAMGYNGLFRAFLVYSAFELFLKIFGETQPTITAVLSPYDPVSSIQSILNVDSNKQFYNFIYAHLDKPNAKNGLSFAYNGTSANITYIASGIRHIFAHGHLSAHANECKPETVKEICDTIFEFHARVMEQEFTKLIQNHKSSI
jgi:hypothetical protein